MTAIIKQEFFPLLESYGFNIIKYKRIDCDYDLDKPEYDVYLNMWVDDNGHQYETSDAWWHEKDQDILKHDPNYFEQYYGLFIGNGRMGQQYYLQVDKDKELTILATEPDGSGCACSVPFSVVEIIAKLHSDNAFEQ